VLDRRIFTTSWKKYNQEDASRRRYFSNAPKKSRPRRPAPLVIRIPALTQLQAEDAAVHPETPLPSQDMNEFGANPLFLPSPTGSPVSNHAQTPTIRPQIVPQNTSPRNIKSESPLPAPMDVDAPQEDLSKAVTSSLVMPVTSSRVQLLASDIDEQSLVPKPTGPILDCVLLPTLESILRQRRRAEKKPARKKMRVCSDDEEWDAKSNQESSEDIDKDTDGQSEKDDTLSISDSDEEVWLESDLPGKFKN
jgi:hypothetical protein